MASTTLMEGPIYLMLHSNHFKWVARYAVLRGRRFLTFASKKACDSGKQMLEMWTMDYFIDRGVPQLTTVTLVTPVGETPVASNAIDYSSATPAVIPPERRANCIAVLNALVTKKPRSFYFTVDSDEVCGRWLKALTTALLAYEESQEGSGYMAMLYWKTLKDEGWSSAQIDEVVQMHMLNRSRQQLAAGHPSPIRTTTDQIRRQYHTSAATPLSSTVHTPAASVSSLAGGAAAASTHPFEPSASSSLTTNTANMAIAAPSSASSSASSAGTGITTPPLLSASFTPTTTSAYPTTLMENRFPAPVIESEAATTALSTAEALQTYLQEGGSASAVFGADKNSLLMEAVGRGDATLVRLLLEAGANVHHRSRHGDSALHVALRRGDHEAAKMLLSKGADAFSVQPCAWEAASFSILHALFAPRVVLEMHASEGPASPLVPVMLLS